MKRKSLIFFLLIALVFTTVFTGCGKKEEKKAESPAEKVETTEAESPAEKEPVKADGPKNTLVFGSNTAADGNWLSYGFWGNNATDRIVNHLMGHMGSVQHDFDGELLINETVVEKPEIKSNDDGSKTYTWKIKEGLVYSDGTPITGKDFAVGAVLMSSPQMALMEAKTALGANKLKGFEEFTTGTKKEFSGVRLIDDMTVSITIDAKHLPNFYEMATASVGPTKLSFWVGDDVDIKDDGNGVYFTGGWADMVTYGEREKDAEGKNIEPARTPEQEELFNKYKPMIEAARNSMDIPSSGPYVLKSFDQATKEVVLEKNDKYPGDYTGRKPTIQTVVIRETKNQTQMDQLKTGEIDVLTLVMSGDNINAGLDIVEKEEGKFDYITYPRAGYGMLHFQSDHGPTRFKEVRQAIAHLIDRPDFVQRFTGGFGTVVDGPYGEGQWFYKASQAELQKTLNSYSYSLETAVKLLEQAGYTLNEKGEEFKTGTDAMRYRKDEESGELEPLKLRWSSTKDNPVSETLVVLLQKNKDVIAAGMVIEQDQMDFGELYAYYRRSTEDPKYREPTYHMFNLATGFGVTTLPDKSYTTKPEEIEQGLNVFYLLDEELDKKARALTNFEPSQKEEFRKAWVEFVQKWNDLMPQVPLYSNTIHDFFNAKVKNYQNTAFSTETMSILYADIED